MGQKKSSDVLDVMIVMVLFDYMKQRITLFTELERATDLAELCNYLQGKAFQRECEVPETLL